jgi:hypothetical protein
LKLDVLFDDGAVVYINGIEVARFNMPSGNIAFNTWASSGIGGAQENQFSTKLIPGSVLNAGENQIAVEIHQVDPTSSDIGFDLSLNTVQGLIVDGN